MLPTDLQRSIFLNKFFTYYKQVIKEKERAIQGTVSPQDHIEEQTDERITLVLFIFRRLTSFLEEQALTIVHEGGPFSVSYYEEIQYILCAMTDEIFLNLNWKGKDLWDQYLLETKFFGTQIAGEKFFENLDSFLSTRDPLRIDIGAIYYLTLALGFRGKYKGIDDHGSIQIYKNKLFLFIMRREPKLYEGKMFLFPETYDLLQDSSLSQKLPNPRLWYSLYAALVVGMGLIGSAAWYYATINLSTTVQSIIAKGQERNP